MPVTFNYKFDNFIEIPTTGSTTIRLFDKYGTFRYELNPDVCSFYSKNSVVVINVEDEKDITLDFCDQNEALRSITKLNSIKISLSEKFDGSEYYTKNELLYVGVLDPRYYVKSEVYTKSEVDDLIASGGTFDSSYYYNTGQTYNKVEVNNLIISSSAYTLYMYNQSTGYTNQQVLNYYNQSTGYTNQQVLNYYNQSTGYTNTQLLNYYTKTEADALFVTGDTFDSSKYYTIDNLQISGQSLVHWLNISNNPFTAQEYTYPSSSGPFTFDSFISGNSFSVSWTYAIRCNTIGQTGVKIAQIYACWDNTSGTVEFGEYGTVDIGDTLDLEGKLQVDSIGGQIFLRTNAATTYSWTMRWIRNSL